MKKNDKPIIVEQPFSTTVENVWNSITEIDQIHKWFFENISSFKPEIGFETQFAVKSGDRSFLPKWKITEVVLLKMIKYNWKYGGCLEILL